MRQHPTHLNVKHVEVFTHPDTGKTIATTVQRRHPLETLRLQRLAHQLGRSQIKSTHRQRSHAR